MVNTTRKGIHRMGWTVFTAVFLTWASAPVFAGGYDAPLKGVGEYEAVYEVTQGNPTIANAVFWAVRDSYQAAAVKALPGDPHVVVVFHGPAVKLISSDRSPFNDAEWKEVQKFQDTLKQMKKDGVKMEVCDYALKVMSVDHGSVIQEVDHVDNGFVSVIGYQMQGYAVVQIP